MQVYSGILCKKNITSGDNVLNGIGDSRKRKLLASLTFVHHAVLSGIRIPAQIDLLAVRKNQKSVLFRKFHSLTVQCGIHD